MEISRSRDVEKYKLSEYSLAESKEQHSALWRKQVEIGEYNKIKESVARVTLNRANIKKLFSWTYFYIEINT